MHTARNQLVLIAVTGFAGGGREEAPGYAPRTWTSAPTMPQQVDEYWGYFPTYVPRRDQFEDQQEE